MSTLTLTLEKVSKRYDRDWVIRNFSARFDGDRCYGIQGRNGSGKSTLLRMIAGHLSPSRGRVSYRSGDRTLANDQIFDSVSYVAPYVDPILELTLVEALDFHFGFKPLRPGLAPADLPEMMQLEKWANRPISGYSSGMRQRVMLGMALFSDTPILLLDEPTTTLDRTGQDWFQEQLSRHRGGRITIIATNVEEDLAQCGEIFTL